MIKYEGAEIQLLDLPGIIEGAAQGKGRGRQVIAVARTADMVLMMLDATKGEIQRLLYYLFLLSILLFFKLFWFTFLFLLDVCLKKSWRLWEYD